MDDNEKELRRRYPTMPQEPEPVPVQPIDPHLVQRYPTMATPAERQAAARELAPEINPPPGLQVSSPEFIAYKTAVQAAGLDNASANRLLSEYQTALQKLIAEKPR